MDHILLSFGALMTGFWGVAHLLATKAAVAGFGNLSADNRRILTMEWLVEGVALISVAAFVGAVTMVDPDAVVSLAVYAVAIATLIALAGVSLFTGFKVAFCPSGCVRSFLPAQLCSSPGARGCEHGSVGAARLTGP